MVNFTPSIIVFAFCIAAIQGCNRCCESPAAPENACSGEPEFWDYKDDYESDNGGLTGVVGAGSLIVNPGCTYYGFYDYDFGGEVKDFPAGLYSLVEPPNSPNNPECANRFNSVKCRCQQELVSCVPEDGWAVKLVCDATGASEPVECNYCKCVGTSWTEEVSESMSISAGVSAEISAGFFNLFSATIGASLETGYNWTETSSETMGELECFEVLATALPGRTLYIEQAVGHCDGNDAQTELFQIYDVGQDGERANVRRQYHFKNGTVVDV